MNVFVLLNASAGTWDQTAIDELGARILAGFSARGVQATLDIVQPARLHDAAANAAKGNWDTLVAGGGDGTVNTVANVLVGSEKALGILPLGTLNHFAKDLRIPLTLDEAIANVCETPPRPVDLGGVNGRLFINNSSIGFYPLAVQDRDRQRKKFGRGKWAAMFLALMRVFRWFPLVDVTVATKTQQLKRRTPLVFVGNNEYQLDLLTLGARTCLTAGTLTLYTANCTTRWGMVRLLVRAMFGTLRQAQDFDSLCSPTITVQSRRRRLSVALDGETQRMSPPLEFKSLPGALLVHAPPEPQPPANSP